MPDPVIIPPPPEQPPAAPSPTGTPVVAPKLTPYFFAGFTLCGAITTAAMSFEGVIPRGVLVAAAIGTMFFGGLLGLGPGLRK